MMGTDFTRTEAKRALKVLEQILETEEGWQLVRAASAVNQIYAALAILEDYLANSTPKPLTRERTREELYAQQVGASAT